MKLLLDMNISPIWVNFLTTAGHDAIHWSSIGKPNATDKEIFDWCKANDYVLMTHDLDFSAILASTKNKKPSIVQIRSQEIMPKDIGIIILNSLKQFEKELQQGIILLIDKDRLRVRILPLD